MAMRDLELRQAHRLLAPGPVTLLTSQYRGQANLMTASLVTVVSLDPPLVGVSIHPARLSHEFVSKSEQFALNLPHIEQVAAASADEEAFDTGWQVGEEGGQLLHHLGENLYAALSKAYRA